MQCANDERVNKNPYVSLHYHVRVEGRNHHTGSLSTFITHTTTITAKKNEEGPQDTI